MEKGTLVKPKTIKDEFWEQYYAQREKPVPTGFGTLMNQIGIPQEKLAGYLAKPWFSVGERTPQEEEQMQNLGRLVSSQLPYETTPEMSVLGSLRGIKEPGKIPTITRKTGTGEIPTSKPPMPEGAKIDYRGLHTAPGADSGSPLHDLKGTYPEDIYGPKATQYYGHYGQNNFQDHQSISIMQSFKNKPNSPVKIYRAIPINQEGKIAKLEKRQREILRRGSKNPKEYDENYKTIQELKRQKLDSEQPQINPGDWVTINRTYAKEHGESTLNGEYQIISKTVKAKDIFTNGDSIHEWGYDPKPPGRLK